MKIKNGATRIVFIFNRFVIKVPNIREYKLFLQGILSNLQEKTFSGWYVGRLANVYFCDVLGLFLVMEKAEEVTNMNDDELYEYLYRNIYNKIPDDDGEKIFMMSDCKVNNWGYINGKLVKIDYGN